MLDNAIKGNTTAVVKTGQQVNFKQQKISVFYMKIIQMAETK